jgi:hypothetical protein
MFMFNGQNISTLLTKNELIFNIKLFIFRTI